MSKQIKLTAVRRPLASRSSRNALRRSLKIPAVVYGHGRPSENLTLEYREFERMYAEAGTSNIIDLAIEGEPKALPVLVSDIQRHPLTERYLHVDLYVLRMDEKLRTEISIQFIGESPAVKEQQGDLIISKDMLSVECLPQDLVPAFEVDLSVLQKLDDSIHVRDIAVPAGITVLDSADVSIASVRVKRVEQPDAAPVVPAEGEAEAVGADAAKEEPTQEPKEKA